MTTYYVTNWDTRAIIAETTNESGAKRLARQAGHNGYTDNGTEYEPAAFVAVDIDGMRCCYYNPKFRVGKDDNYKATPLVKVNSDRQETALERGIANAATARTQLRAWEWPGLR